MVAEARYDAVQPMLGEHLPNLNYSAGLIGGGSEVLGFDSEISTHHDWGPRVMLFVRADDPDTAAPAIRTLAMDHVSLTYRDYATRIYSPDRRDIVSRFTMKLGEPGAPHRCTHDRGLRAEPPWNRLRRTRSDGLANDPAAQVLLLRQWQSLP